MSGFRNASRTPEKELSNPLNGIIHKAMEIDLKGDKKKEPEG